LHWPRNRAEGLTSSEAVPNRVIDPSGRRDPITTFRATVVLPQGHGHATPTRSAESRIGHSSSSFDNGRLLRAMTFSIPIGCSRPDPYGMLAEQGVAACDGGERSVGPINKEGLKGKNYIQDGPVLPASQPSTLLAEGDPPVQCSEGCPGSGANAT